MAIGDGSEILAHSERRASTEPGQALASAHPSAPIPVQGEPVGAQVRIGLGETGLSAFPLLLGGAEFGWTVDLPASHSILDAYRARGGNAVHTSDSFAGGRSEHIIGEWLRTRGIRDEMVLAIRVGAHPDNPGMDPVNLVRAVEASLTRLGTDRIDVLYLNASDGLAAVEDTLATAEWLVEAGKARAIGAYGFTAEQLVEARILASAGYPRITVLDVPYNMLRRQDFTGDLRLVASAQQMAVTPSHALEHGFLAGRHRTRTDVGRSVRGRQLASSMNKRGGRTLRALDAIGAELGVPQAAVAVAWLLAQRIVTAPIVNAFAPAHVDELVQGVGIRLSRAQLAEISRAAD
ncbi:aldo/keto reductase [Microbacterium sp. SYP-A9085]|jgi:aryl-alcohol dehydrogenase-like predicted oxidoreductase|uniref:aldo/keto reductase n=1 Tax=Microbacterium sp. SYP-A9085 TaxID=2664454 RepID=UPI00129A53EA|nr:aldo/keto reductase [Microbacterium sp. SYP-A9085]MRH29270.1 aldo/keto reductase [Microbacterium sp. SYP-A9085]